MPSVKTYHFVIELEDDPVNPFTSEDVRDIEEHITNSMNGGIALHSSGEVMYLANAFKITVKENTVDTCAQPPVRAVGE